MLNGERTSQYGVRLPHRARISSYPTDIAPLIDIFSDDPSKFSILFRRILAMSLDDSLSLTIRTHILGFMISAFESLDSSLIRKECAPLVSIAIWNQLSSEETRNDRFEKYPSCKKLWRASGKKYDAADEEGKAKLRSDRSWLTQMILVFYNLLYAEPVEGQQNRERVVYVERFVEFLVDLESQLPTRRYVNFLLRDLQVLTVIKRSPLYNEDENGLFREMVGLLDHFIHFSIDDHTGEQLTREESRKIHCQVIGKLQRVSLKHFKEKLTILALTNYGAIAQREELATHLKALTDEQLKMLCEKLLLRTEYPKGVSVVVDKAFLTEVVLAAHEKRKTYQDEIADMAVLPTEVCIQEDGWQSIY